MQEKLKEIDSNDLEAVKLMLENNIVNDIDEAIENVPNMVSTGESSMEDVAQNYINESSLLEKMPENLQCYFDFESFDRDMEMNGCFYEDEEGVLWEFVA